MRRIVIAAAVAFSFVALISAQSKHLTPLVDLLAAKKPVFGLYTPGGGRGAAARPPPGV